jgi:diacylglycerol kinase (ATP)
MNRNAPRLLVIVNHAAGRARRVWPQIKNTLRTQGIRFDEHATTHAGDATTQTRNALREGYNIIAIVGGDGTLSEAASGFFDFNEEGANASIHLPHTPSHLSHAPPPFSTQDAIIHPPLSINTKAALAVLPAGTGNDFARGLLAGKRAALELWVEKLIAYCRHVDANTSRVVDVIYGNAHNAAQNGAQTFIALNAATFGIGAETARRVAAQRGLTLRLSGEARFVAAACGALLAWRERPARITINDGNNDEKGIDEIHADKARIGEATIIECRTNILAIANNIYAGGGMMFAPRARPDDGLLDVLIACHLSRAEVLRELPRIRKGTHLSNQKVRTFTARRVRVETLDPNDPLLIEADGNVRGHTPAAFRILPAALRIV